MGPQARSVIQASRLGSSAAPPQGWDTCAHRESPEVWHVGSSRGPPGCGLSTGRPGAGVPLKAAVVGGCAEEGGESQARSQTTLHPEAHRRLHRSRLGPVQPAALCCPPVAAAQRPTPPPTRPQLRAAGGARGRAAREAAGLWLSGRGPQGPGHPHCGLCHALPIPGGPRAAPHEGITRAQTWPPTHTDHAHAIQGRPRWPGRAARSQGQRQGPCHGRRPCPPHSDPGPPGLPPSAMQGAARSHADEGRPGLQPAFPPTPRRPGVSAWLQSPLPKDLQM